MKSSQQVAGGVRKKLADTVGAGAALWAMGYALGMILFAFVPVAMIGLIVLPIMAPVTVYVAFSRLKTGAPVSYVLLVASTWTAIAVAFDYAFLVSAFSAQDYYDLDVLVYYALTFLIPAAVGARYRRN
ncbi:MAG: hypothetical protein QXJ74_04550 [Nitrososphaera sp.]